MKKDYIFYILKLLPINIEDLNYMEVEIPYKLYNIINSLKIKNEIGSITIHLSNNLYDIAENINDLKIKYSALFNINIKFGNEFAIINNILNYFETKINKDVIIINLNNLSLSETIVKEYDGILKNILENFKVVNNNIYFIKEG